MPGLTRNPSERVEPYDGFRIGAASPLVRNDGVFSRKVGFAGGSGYRAGKASLSAIQVRAMSEQLPDRLSVNPESPFYNEEVLARDIGIRFKGVEKTNVEEYCVSEGWVKVAAGNAKDRFGRPMTITLKGLVEPYVRGNAEG
jgi:hypothetical protein